MKKPHGNILTLLLAAVIIAAGVVLPPLIYPLMDQYSNKITQLQASDTASVVFQEPVSLYPWNVYDESRTRELYPSEVNTIIESKVPDFLLGFLLARGVDIDSNTDFRESLLSSFRYLSVSGDRAEDCYVLEMDLNGDGVPDLSCATDLNGNVISTIVLTDDYQTIQVALPASVSPDQAAGDTGAGAGAAANPATDADAAGTADAAGAGAAANPGTVTDAAGDTGTGAADSADATAGADTETTAADAANAAGTTDADADAGATVATDAGTDASAADTADAADTNANAQAPSDNADTLIVSVPDASQAPVNENLNLWAFVYTTQKEAENLASPALADSFTQVDDYFQAQYGYVFTNYLRFVYGLPQSSESVSADTNSNLRLLVLNNSQYQFNIYNLPSSQRVILYLNPQTRACVGFTIQDLESR
ncbi:MAG: hypothetical protein FWF30_03185 [Coriobacteriia bacterium]|nr:hypothetical protein [Coriobacteriia bacterium]